VENKTTLASYFNILGKPTRLTPEEELETVFEIERLGQAYWSQVIPYRPAQDIINTLGIDPKESINIIEVKCRSLTEKVFNSLIDYHKVNQEADTINFNQINEIITTQRKLKHKFIKANSGLVMNVVQIVKQHRISKEDLLQEGHIGLIRALDHYNPRLGYRFSTYAFYSIKQHIHKAIKLMEREIRLPVENLLILKKTKTEQNKFFTKFGRNPSLDELAALVGVDVASIVDIYLDASLPLSLESSYKDYSFSLLDITDNGLPNAYDILEGKQIKENIDRVLKQLTPIEQQVLGFDTVKTIPITIGKSKLIHRNALNKAKTILVF
jgi:RNA polymerase sigma factor (sigma-70 family)